MYICCVCEYEYKCFQMLELSDPSKAGVSSGCEMPDMGSGNLGLMEEHKCF